MNLAQGCSEHSFPFTYILFICYMIFKKELNSEQA